MTNTNRRTFLAMSGAGVAAVGVAAVPNLAGATESASEPSHKPHGGPAETEDELLLAHVTDLRKGEVTVVHGSVETTFVDRDLASKILKSSGTVA
jgi:hypothetical protein